MNLRKAAKQFAEHLPQPLARLAVRVPFSMRLGPAYSATRALVREDAARSPGERAAWMLARLQDLVQWAHAESPFYRSRWEAAGFHPDKLRSLGHFQDVPVVSKQDLMTFDLERRSHASRGRMRLNTGGTRGQPLEFHVDGQAFAREWAHMHEIWFRAGYDVRHLKLTFRGRNLGERAISFNPVHNEYIVNTYADRHKVADALAATGRLADVRWLHGYPSVVSDWVMWLARERADVFTPVRDGLKGVLLGSEFPAPIYRDAISGTASSNIVAWYGHSEMCVLAPETSINLYRPMPTYGLAEAVEMGDGMQHLVGTSLWNRAGPFIRYDTGDGIAGMVEDGLLKEFRVMDGRIGEFVTDRRGERIGLTALIFGRHHAAFEKASHIQVRQDRQGQMDVLVVPRDTTTPQSEIAGGFDFSNVEIDVRVHLIEEPVRAASGKISLLVPGRGG